MTIASPLPPSGKRAPRGVLTVLAIAQSIVVLDIAIVNVALPDIQSGFSFSADGLQRVISAYTLMFGGFLLVGGRAVDLIGRRRMFVVGLIVFGAASLAAGLAVSADIPVILRAVQGVGGALLSESAFSLLTDALSWRRVFLVASVGAFQYRMLIAAIFAAAKIVATSFSPNITPTAAQIADATGA